MMIKECYYWWEFKEEGAIKWLSLNLIVKL